MNDLCPFCEKGTLHASTRVEDVEHNGKQLRVQNFQVSTCDSCLEEMVRSDQAKINQKLVADACLESEGKLSTGDLKCLRMRYRLSQADAVKLFGGGANAFSKYERGEVMQSKAMDLLIRAYDAFPDVREFLATKAGLHAPAVWISADNNPTRFSKPLPRPSTFAVSMQTVWETVDNGRKYGRR